MASNPNSSGPGGGSAGGSGSGASGIRLVTGGIAIQRYDPAEFLVGGKGKGDGELESITFKIHEGYRAEIGKWLDRAVFPYKDRTDWLRHAVVRHCYYLRSVEGEVEGTLLHTLSRLDRSTADWRIQNDFVQHIDRIDEQVKRTLSLPGGKHQVERVVRWYRKQIELSKDDGFYKGVYLKMFDDRFGVYMPQNLTLVSGYSSDDRGWAEAAEAADETDQIEFGVPDFGGDEYGES